MFESWDFDFSLPPRTPSFFEGAEGWITKDTKEGMDGRVWDGDKIIAYVIDSTLADVREIRLN